MRLSTNFRSLTQCLDERVVKDNKMQAGILPDTQSADVQLPKHSSRGTQYFMDVKLRRGHPQAVKTTKPQGSLQVPADDVYLLDLGGTTVTKKSKIETAWWMRIAGRQIGNYIDGVKGAVAVTLRSPFARAQANLDAKSIGKRTNGWNIKSDKLGSILNPNRIYATLQDAIPGTDIKLPGTVNVLYEAIIQENGKSQNIPFSVLSAEAIIQKEGVTRIVSIGSMANVIEIGRVGRFQLSDKYWLLSPLKRGRKVGDSQGTEQKKPTLVIVSHGHEDNQTTPVPLNKNIGYFGPSKADLIDIGLGVMQSEKLYGEQWIDENDNHVIHPMAAHSSDKKEMLANISGSEKKKEMADLQLSKYGSITGNAIELVREHKNNQSQKKKAQTTETMQPAVYHRDGDSLRELCYLANDNDWDIVTVRKNQKGSLSDLFSQLQKEGLWERYGRILIHACRSEHDAKERPVYDPGIHNPLPENAPQKTYVV